MLALQIFRKYSNEIYLCLLNKSGYKNHKNKTFYNYIKNYFLHIIQT